MNQKDIDEAVQLAKWINSGRVADWSVSLEGVRQLAYALEAYSESNKRLTRFTSIKARIVSPTEINNPDPGGLY